MNLEQLQKQLEEKKLELKSLLMSAAEQAESLKNHKEAKADAEQHRTDLIQQIAGLNDQIVSLEEQKAGETQAAMEKIDSINADIAAIEAIYTDENGVIAAPDTWSEAHQTDHANLKQKASDVLQKMEDGIGEIQVQIKDAETEKGDVQVEVEDTDKTIAEETGNVAAIEAEIAQLNAEEAKVREKIKEVEAQIFAMTQSEFAKISSAVAGELEKVTGERKALMEGEKSTKEGHLGDDVTAVDDNLTKLAAEETKARTEAEQVLRDTFEAKSALAIESLLGEAVDPLFMEGLSNFDLDKIFANIVLTDGNISDITQAALVSYAEDADRLVASRGMEADAKTEPAKIQFSAIQDALKEGASSTAEIDTKVSEIKADLEKLAGDFGLISGIAEEYPTAAQENEELAANDASFDNGEISPDEHNKAYIAIRAKYRKMRSEYWTQRGEEFSPAIKSLKSSQKAYDAPANVLPVWEAAKAKHESNKAKLEKAKVEAAQDATDATKAHEDAKAAWDAEQTELQNKVDALDKVRKSSTDAYMDKFKEFITAKEEGSQDADAIGTEAVQLRQTAIVDFVAYTNGRNDLNREVLKNTHALLLSSTKMDSCVAYNTLVSEMEIPVWDSEATQIGGVPASQYVKEQYEAEGNVTILVNALNAQLQPFAVAGPEGTYAHYYNTSFVPAGGYWSSAEA